jgi:CRISPR/Cas system CSM-associated protein Csm2 small subunit
MIRPNLEKRVKSLEAQVAELQSARASLAKDWRRTIGVFTDDAGMQEILKEAMRLREADRRRAYKKTPRKAKR